MLNLLDYFKLFRVNQWYKNIVIFIPLFFSLQLFNKDLFLNTLIGFFSLCFISSSGYIINDFSDIKKDKHHPEKKNRPLVSKKIKIPVALILSMILVTLKMVFMLLGVILASMILL